MAQEKTQLQKNLSDAVLSRVNELTSIDSLVLPSDYIPGNALKAAWLMLPTIEDKDKKPALEVCTPESIQNALFDMCVRGLNPYKKQGYFIVFGKQLQWMTSYHGNQTIAKRVAGLVKIKGNAIYEKDTFIYEIDPKTGQKIVKEHKQNLENIDITKIKGAYATFELADGTLDMIPMTIQQIKQSWLMGSAKGASKAHENFTDEMAIKSVINRACKHLINTSSDALLMAGNDHDSNAEIVKENEDKNTVDIEFTDVSDPKNPVVNPAPDGQSASPQVTASPQATAAQIPQQKQVKDEAPEAKAPEHSTAVKLEF